MNLEPHYQALRSYFRSVDDHHGKALAEQLTARMNETISQQKTVLTSLTDWDSSLRLIVEALPAQPAALSLPWQAYHAAQWEHDDEWHTGATIEAVLATVPKSYRMDVQTPVDFVAPYEGSLIAYLADLIRSTQNHLWVINPYWSIAGVERLKRRFASNHSFMKTVTLLTPANMAQETLAGCNSFKTWMESKGVTVQHLAPLPMPNGKWPLVHAKVMIADQERAYIGSANVSDNGLVNSIEMGVGVRGPVVRHLINWYQAMTHYFEKIDT